MPPAVLHAGQHNAFAIFGCGRHEFAIGIPYRAPACRRHLFAMDIQQFAAIAGLKKLILPRVQVLFPVNGNTSIRQERKRGDMQFAILSRIRRTRDDRDTQFPRLHAQIAQAKIVLRNEGIASDGRLVSGQRKFGKERKLRPVPDGLLDQENISPYVFRNISLDR